jgi:hypothetical protein
MIARETVGIIACGLAAGLVAAYFLTHLVANKLFGVTATDPVVTACAVATLSLVGLIAATLPAASLAHRSSHRSARRVTAILRS